jgi:hypothetical protein
VKLVIPVAAVGVAIAVPAEASSNGSPASDPVRANPVQRPGMISPLIGIAPKTAAQAATASSTCVRYATERGGPATAISPGTW